MGILGVGNPAPGIGKTIGFVGRSAIDKRNHWGAWSGKIIVNANTVTGIEGLSPSVGCIMRINFGYNAAGGGLSGDSLGYFLFFNEEQVLSIVPRNTAGQNNPDFHIVYIPVPSETQVRLDHYTTESGNVNTYSILSFSEI